MADKKVTLIPGDGIGPEVVVAVQRVLKEAGARIEWEEVNAGLDVYKVSGKLIPNELIDSLNSTRVALKGPTTTPVGTGHRSINVTMRQTFNLYANVRPVKTIQGVGSIHRDVDLIIVRENTEDLYKGIEYKVGDRAAHGIKLITADASERVARFAFELARRHGRRGVTAVHKANIMKFTDGMFLESARRVASEYPEVPFSDCIIDNCCMQLVTKPKQFDILVTLNLYGDIISDLASGLVGGLGVASGANFGDGCAIFEAVHGSAPDIAGQDLANPTALLQSAVSMLHHIDQDAIAEKVDAALKATLADEKTHTRDLGGTLTTTEFTNAVIDHLGK